MLAKESSQFVHRLFDIFRLPVSFNMGRAGNFEQFLVARAGGIGKGFFGHIQRIGFVSGNHQQRLVNQINIGIDVKFHQIEQTADGAIGFGIGMEMAVGIVFIALAVQVHGNGGDLFRGHARAKFRGVLDFAGLYFFFACDGGSGEALLDGIFLTAQIAVAAGVAGIEHTEGSDRFEALVGLRALIE